MWPHADPTWSGNEARVQESRIEITVPGCLSNHYTIKIVPREEASQGRICTTIKNMVSCSIWLSSITNTKSTACN